MIAESGTVVLVSHSLGLLSSICSRIILLENGSIVSSGDPEQTLKDYSNLLKLD